MSKLYEVRFCEECKTNKKLYSIPRDQGYCFECQDRKRTREDLIKENEKLRRVISDFKKAIKRDIIKCDCKEDNE